MFENEGEKDFPYNEKAYLKEARSLSEALFNIGDKVRKSDAPYCFQSNFSMESKTKVRPTQNKAEWFDAMNSIFELNKTLIARKEAIEDSLRQIDDFTISLGKCFPAEYDQSIFEGGWLYQGKWILKSPYWGFSGASEDRKELLKADYDKCVELFHIVTKGLPTHNFSICLFDNRSSGEFVFTVAEVPGKFEITFPMPVAQVHTEGMRCGIGWLPFQMHLTWRFHDIIPILDHFWGHSYHLADINKSLREFVEKETWRDVIKKQRCKDGVIEEWLEEEIQKSIAKASVEENRDSKQE